MQTPEAPEIGEPTASLSLLPRIAEVLSRIADSEQRARTERFYQAAAAALAGLLQLEKQSLDSDLKINTRRLWPVLAPQFRATLEYVRDFLEVVRREYPAGDDDDGPGLDLDLAFAEDAVPTTADSEPDRGSEIASVIRAIIENLARELGTMQKSLGHFAQVEDRWNLLETLGEFRGKARAGIGEAVFLVSREYAVVRKQDVVPFYIDELNASLALRQALGRFRRAYIPLQSELLAEETWADEAAAVRVLGLLGLELDSFLAGDAYRIMRSADQRAFFEVRRDIAWLDRESTLPRAELHDTVEGFTRFLESLLLINRREALVLHDREVIDACQREAARVHEEVAGGNPGEAIGALERLREESERLLGTNPTFDRVAFELLALDSNSVDPATAVRLADEAANSLAALVVRNG